MLNFADEEHKTNLSEQKEELYNSKRMFYTEGTVYPYLRLYDFNSELFKKARNLIYSYNPSHAWLNLTDEQLLKKAGLWKFEYQTGIEGYTLAAVLLFGKDDVIQQILPQYKFDALLKTNSVDRYDDRIYIQTNLIDAYDILINFIAKYLPEKFYLEGTQRKDLRIAIFREIIANMIVHREYTNALAASLTIYKDRVETVNANNPHFDGEITPDNITPFSKNPSIAKFFIQLGRVEELGSGVLNVNKYLPAYILGAKPRFIEGTVFKTIIPLNNIYNSSEKEFNSGTITTANGTVNSEVGTVSGNDGTVNQNDGTVTKKDDIVKDKGGIVNSEVGTVSENDGTVKSILSDTVQVRIKRKLIEEIGNNKKSKIIENTLNGILNVFLFIASNQGKKSGEISIECNISVRTLRRYLDYLSQYIKFVGAPKIGGYYLTEKGKELIKGGAKIL